VPPSAPDILFTDQESLEDLLSKVGAELRTGDPDESEPDGIADADELRRVATARAIGTAKVMRYAQRRYDAADLAASWTVWEWATCFGAVWLCRRRGNPVPEELLEYAAECLKELEAVAAGDMAIEDVGERVTDGPAWSNTVLDPRYRGRQIRVQRNQSERTPRERPPAVDRVSDYLGTEEY
jgi:hypothetical protein